MSFLTNKLFRIRKINNFTVIILNNTLVKTIFTSILCLFFLLSGYKEAFPQSGYIVPYTIKSSSLEPDTYYPMAGFNSSAYEEYSYVKGSTFMNMRLMFPDGYDSLADDGKEYPLILMLHGAGESALTDWSVPGRPNYAPDDPKRYNNDHQLLFGGKEHLDAKNRAENHQRHWPGFALFPQSSHNGNWQGNQNDMVIELLEILIDSLKIDPLRIYVWGLSNGASGTWEIIDKRPDLFAAALPMSGVGPVDHNRLAHMPIWLFQGSLDTNPRPNGAGNMINNLKRAGGTPRYTLYEGVGHGTWHNAYKEPDFYTWMLQYSELSIHVFENAEFTGQVCGGMAVNAKLGISPGHDAYEWRKVGDTQILGTSHNLVVHEIGQYEVRIKTRGSSEWTEWSEPAEVKIRDPFIPPVAVSGSTTFPSLDNAPDVTLSYEGQYYQNQIFWQRNKNGESWGTQQNGASSITVSGSNNAVMYYRVRLTEPNRCNSEYSDTIAVTKNLPTNVITPPDQLSLIPTSETQINLFWNDNSNDEKGFEIYRSEDNGLTYVFVTKTQPNQVHFADTGLKADTEYTYNMRAVNFKGSSPYTGKISARTYEDTEAPARPGNLVATSNLDMQSVSLTWEPARDNVGVSEYRVFEVLSNNMLHLIGTTSETNFQVSGLQESTLYTYVVKAIDPSNNLSEASNYASVVTEICGVKYSLYIPEEGEIYKSVHEFLPEHIVATGFVNNFDIGIRTVYPAFDGTNADDHFGFEFEGYINITQAGNYDFVLNSDDGSILWINDIERININVDRGEGDSDVSRVYLSQGRHKIKVRYYENAGGQSLLVKYRRSNSGNAIVPIPDAMLCIDEYSGPPAPSAPSDLVAQAVSENQINLSWTDNSSDEYGFELYRAKAAQGPFELVYTSDEDITAFEDNDLDPNTTYFYKVKAISAQGPSAYSTKEGGIDYEYYEGSWSVLPDFSSLTAVRTGTTSNFGLGLGERANNFGYVFEGNISIPRDGEYIFYTSSDDGSKLYINDEEIVDNDGPHGMQERAGSVYLTAGLHSIRVPYYQGGGGKGLEVRYEGPGINKQLIPNDVLNFVSATTSGDFTDPEAPTNLQVLNKTAFSVGLSWTAATDNVDVKGYIVYSVVNGEAQDTLAITDQFGIVIANDNVATTANNLVAKPFAKANAHNGMSLLSTTATLPTISTEVRGLDPETDYSVFVKAFDGAGNLSAPSNIQSFITNVDPANPLPIELISFTGAADYGLVQLTWKTASEKDNDFFTIERAVNSKIFEAIGEVDGAGNSIIERDYFFEDVAPVIGTLFYRLKQTDFNGDFAYSDIIAIQYPTVSSINKQGIDNIILYPNPASSENINLKLDGHYTKAPISLKVADMLGKVHLSYQFEADDLAKGLRLDSRYKLSPGIYVVIIEQASQVKKLKLIIKE